MSVRLEQFCRILEEVIHEAYVRTDPHDGISMLVSDIENLIRQRAARYVRTYRIRGKIFVRYLLDGRPFGLNQEFRFVRELADIILCLNLEGSVRVVFIQLKNTKVSLDDIERGQRALEELIGQYDPSQRTVRLANKGQLLILSGYLERVLSLVGQMSLQQVCTSGMFAEQNLPRIIRLGARQYVYCTQSCRHGQITINTRFLRVYDVIRCTTTIYVFSYTEDDTIYVTAQRAGDLLYSLCRWAFYPYRPGVIEEAFLDREFRNLLTNGIASVRTDITLRSTFLNDRADFKLRTIRLFMRDLGLRYLLSRRNIHPLTVVMPQVTTYYFNTQFNSLGSALDRLLQDAIHRQQFSMSSYDVIIEYDSRLSSYTIRDLQLGQDLSEDEYELETEGLRETLIISATVY